MRILFVEDDAVIASGLAYALETDGFEIVHCQTVAQALPCIEGGDFSLALLDLSLPDGSGLDICKRFKERCNAPVIFLTAADDEGNTVKSLDMGADDYVTKPFRIRELLARIKAVLRRYGEVRAETDVLELGRLKIHTLKGKVYSDEAELLLTALEYRLLLTFAQHKNQVLTRGQILESIWDVAGSFVNDNTLSVYIKRLREKIGEGLIVTVRGIGYRAGDGDGR